MSGPDTEEERAAKREAIRVFQVTAAADDAAADASAREDLWRAVDESLQALRKVYKRRFEEPSQ